MGYVRLVARWATICLVGLTMAAFIVFDVLDLDGSTLRNPVRSDTLTADPPALDTERVLSPAGDPSSAPGAQRIVTFLSLPMDPIVVRSTVTTPSRRAHRRIVHLRASRDACRRSAGPSASDPA